MFILIYATCKLDQPSFVNVEVWNICSDEFLDLKVPIKKLAKKIAQKQWKFKSKDWNNDWEL